MADRPDVSAIRLELPVGRRRLGGADAGLFGRELRRGVSLRPGGRRQREGASVRADGTTRVDGVGVVPTRLHGDGFGAGDGGIAVPRRPAVVAGATALGVAHRHDAGVCFVAADEGERGSGLAAGRIAFGVAPCAGPVRGGVDRDLSGVLPVKSRPGRRRRSSPRRRCSRRCIPSRGRRRWRCSCWRWASAGWRFARAASSGRWCCTACLTRLAACCCSGNNYS